MKIENNYAGAGATQIIQVKPEELQPSFFKTSTYESYKNINPRRVPKTCLWFLEHPLFQKWKSSGCDDLLWLSADPGCGKSVLSRALIDEKLVGAKPVVLCYFFFKDNEEQNNAATALCALLHQLLCEHDSLLQRHIAPAFKKCGEALKNDFEELWRTFVSAATDGSAGDVVCILDALDECQVADRNKLIGHLEDFYRRSDNTSKRESKLKFLVTSRPYSEIELKFSSLIRSIPTIRLAGEDESEKISREIGIVMESKLITIAENLELDKDAQSSLHDRLKQIPNRTYLWLHLILDEVESSFAQTGTKLRKVLDTLPQTVEDAYEKILDRCKGEDAKRILHVVLAAQRPLTLSEIDVALEIPTDLESSSLSLAHLDCEGDKRKRSIRKACGLFISIVDSRIFLIHQTAREFLLRKSDEASGPKKWKHSVDIRDAHRVLSEICVTYLLLPEIQQYPGSTEAGKSLAVARRSIDRTYGERGAFLDYSANHWIHHVREAGVGSIDWISRTAKLCEVGDGSSCVWFRVYSKPNYLTRLGHQSMQTGLYWAVLFGLVNEVRYLLESRLSHDGQVSSATKILVEAARNKNHGEELTASLLDWWGADVPITEEVVKAAAENEGNGKDIMTLLLDRRGADVPITEEVVKAAAENEGNGKDIMTLLLNWRGADAPITEEVVKAAAENEGNGKDVMTLLLNRRGADVPITEEVVKAAAGNYRSGKDIMTLLLDRRGADVPITEEVVKAAAENEGNGKDVMTLLLDQRGADVLITEEVVKAAAGNYISGKDVITLLLDRRGADVLITEEVVKAAAENEGNGKDVMTLLLNWRRADVPITEKVVKAAAGNYRSGKDIMTLLLDRRGADVPITEQAVASMIRLFDKDVITLFLDRRGADVPITEEVVKAAAKNYRNGEDLLTLLLDRRGADVLITEEVVKAAAGNYRSGKDIMTLLLDRRGADVPITEEVVKVAAENEGNGKDLITLLLDRRGADVPITEEVVKAAAKNYISGKDVITLLLNRRGADVPISEEVVKAAAENEGNGKDIMTLLHDRRKGEVLEAVLRLGGKVSRIENLGPHSFRIKFGDARSWSFFR